MECVHISTFAASELGLQPYIHLHSSEKGMSFLELSRPLARPPGAGRDTGLTLLSDRLIELGELFFVQE